MLNGMRLRTVYGVLIFLGVGLLIAADALLFSRLRPLGSLILIILAAQGWQEFARITGIRGPGPKASAGLDLLGLLGVGYFFAVAWTFALAGSGSDAGGVPAGVPAGVPGAGPGLWGGESTWIQAGVVGLVFAAMGVGIFCDEFERRYLAILETILGVLLLGFLFSYVLRIYHLPGWRGPVLGAVFVLGVKGNDTAAYYVGKAWGKTHFLKVSPRKTLEGCLGSLVFSLLFFSLAGGLLGPAGPGSLFPWFSGMLFGMMISVASQIGDLGESLIKRVYQVKDSGALLPEFGGVLDMIDSLIFTGFLFWELV